VDREEGCKIVGVRGFLGLHNQRNEGKERMGRWRRGYLGNVGEKSRENGRHIGGSRERGAVEYLGRKIKRRGGEHTLRKNWARGEIPGKGRQSAENCES